MESLAFAQAITNPTAVAAAIEVELEHTTPPPLDTGVGKKGMEGRGMITVPPGTMPVPDSSQSPPETSVAKYEAQRESVRTERKKMAQLYQSLASPHHLQEVLSSEPTQSGPSSILHEQDQPDHRAGVQGKLREWSEETGTSRTPSFAEAEEEVIDTASIEGDPGQSVDELIEEAIQEDKKRLSLKVGLPIHQPDSPPREPAPVLKPSLGPEGELKSPEYYGNWQSALQAVMSKVEELENRLMVMKREHEEEIELLSGKISGVYSSPFGSEAGKMTEIGGGAKRLVSASSAPGPAPSIQVPSVPTGSTLVKPSKCRDVVRRFMVKHKASSSRVLTASVPGLIRDLQACEDIGNYPHYQRITVLLPKNIKNHLIDATLEGMV